jgi:hypothetical protein
LPPDEAISADPPARAAMLGVTEAESVNLSEAPLSVFY